MRLLYFLLLFSSQQFGFIFFPSTVFCYVIFLLLGMIPEKLKWSSINQMRAVISLAQIYFSFQICLFSSQLVTLLIASYHLENFYCFFNCPYITSYLGLRVTTTRGFISLKVISSVQHLETCYINLSFILFLLFTAKPNSSFILIT